MTDNIQSGASNSDTGNSDAGKKNKPRIRLSDEAEKRIEDLITKYPSKKSAIMPALYLAQEELGHLTDEAYEWVAQRVDVSPAHARSVATFYTMYYKEPVGKYHVQVCRTLSCMLCGARNLSAMLKERLGVPAHVVTEDGMWSWEEVECLGSCGSAPMVEINDRYFENLTADSLSTLMDRIEKEQPDLRFHTASDKLGSGLDDEPRSQAWTAKSEGS